jgi:pimeloyl-ACP methyl ester carboxylesterase
MNLSRYAVTTAVILLSITGSGVASETSAFIGKPCAAENPSVKCGTITVPENPRAGNARTIALNVVVVRARKPRAGVPPLFHLDGGPGIAATNVADFYVGPGAGYRESRDVVLFDQRGTGASNPLRCAALEHRHPLEDMYSARDVADCLEGLKPADLSAYSTEAAAQDIDRVRTALGYKTIDIWALSYGTRLAQEYIKRYPDKVHRAVLVGFVPLDNRAPLYHAAAAQRVLDLIFFQCQLDADCSAKYPALRDEWRALLVSLDPAPATATAGTEQVTIRRGPFAEALRTLMTTGAGQRQIPFIIHAASAGNFAPFLERLPKDSSQFAEGLYLTIACSEGGARVKAEDVQRHVADTFLGDYRVRQELAACSQWPVYTVRPDFYARPAASPPVLVMAGEMDNVAPPDWGYRFCAALPACRFVMIPALGHGPFDLDAWTNGACFDDVTQRFYVDGAAVDMSCFKGMRPPAFK